MSEAVIVVHGLAAHPIMMMLLARRIRGAGYDVRNWGYPSISGNIERHAERFSRLLQQYEADDDISAFHLVTHSMGGIVTRRALADEAPSKLKSIVMIAPPNRGSPIAARLSPWLGWMCRPLTELADDKESFVNRLTQTTPRPVGVVACQYDRVVPLASTRLPDLADHVILPAGHNSVLLRRDLAEHTVHFLQTGAFKHETPCC